MSEAPAKEMHNPKELRAPKEQDIDYDTKKIDENSKELWIRASTDLFTALSTINTTAVEGVASLIVEGADRVILNQGDSRVIPEGSKYYYHETGLGGVRVRETRQPAVHPSVYN